MRPEENQTEVCVTQIKDLLARLWEREQSWGQAPPLFVFDAGYDATSLTRVLQYCRVQILVRLNSRRCFYADPPSRAPGKGRRPRRHGPRFVCRNPATWPEPTDEHHCEHADYGEVRVRSWSGLHPKLQSRPGAEPYKRPPVIRGTVVLVEVQAYLARPASHSGSGCGGPELGSPTSIFCGARTAADSISNTPSGF